MSMDPNVQVALVSVFATTITTLGVIAVAVINNRKERDNAASAGVDAALDDGDMLDRMLMMASENQRKESTITALRKQNRELKAENIELKDQLFKLKGT